MSIQYSYLEPAYSHLITIAKLYKIDLTDANEKEKFGNRFGAQEGDINLDIAGAIHTFTIKGKWGISIKAMKTFVIDQLFNWGYDKNEISEAIAKIRSFDY